MWKKFRNFVSEIPKWMFVIAPIGIIVVGFVVRTLYCILIGSSIGDDSAMYAIISVGLISTLSFIASWGVIFFILYLGLRLFMWKRNRFVIAVEKLFGILSINLGLASAVNATQFSIISTGVSLTLLFKFIFLDKKVIEDIINDNVNKIIGKE